MMEEMKALAKNQTWKLITLPSGAKAVGSKSVFTTKHKADRTIDKFKASLIAKGFIQANGIDYQETLAPVAKINSIMVILSCAANLGWELH